MGSTMPSSVRFGSTLEITALAAISCPSARWTAVTPSRFASIRTTSASVRISAPAAWAAAAMAWESAPAPPAKHAPGLLDARHPRCAPTAAVRFRRSAVPARRQDAASGNRGPQQPPIRTTLPPGPQWAWVSSAEGGTDPACPCRVPCGRFAASRNRSCGEGFSTLGRRHAPQCGEDLAHAPQRVCETRCTSRRPARERRESSCRGCGASPRTAAGAGHFHREGRAATSGVKRSAAHASRVACRGQCRPQGPAVCASVEQRNPG